MQLIQLKYRLWELINYYYRYHHLDSYCERAIIIWRRSRKRFPMGGPCNLNLEEDTKVLNGPSWSRTQEEVVTDLPTVCNK